MLDDKYFTVSKIEELDDKYPDELNEVESRCSTPASAVTDEGSLESESELLKQLNSEIDVAQGLLSGTNGQETYLQSKVKPLLEQIQAEANKIVVNCKDVGVLRKSQQDKSILLHCPSLQELKLGLSKNTEESPDDLIACDRDCWLSEIEVLKADMNYAQCRHDAVVKDLQLSLHFAEKKNTNSQMVLQRSLGQSQEKVHSLDYKLKEYQLEVAALQHSLMVSNATSQSLMNTLRAANGRIQSLQQSQKTDQNLKIDVMVTKENNKFLQEKLVSSGENVKSLRQNIIDLEKEFQHYQLASEKKVKSLQQALSSSEQKASSLRESLKMSEEKFVSLRNNHWALEEKLQSVQENLNSFEGRASFLQGSLRMAEEKSKLLNESLRASEEKVQALQKSLAVGDQQLSKTTAQTESLGKCRDQQERIESLLQTLAGAERRIITAVQEMEESVKTSREKMEKLQRALDKTDSMHQREVGQLQQMLNKTRRERDAMDSLYCQQLLKERDQYGGGVSPYFAASLPQRNHS